MILNRKLIIAAAHLKLTDSFIIEINYDKIEALSNEFNKDYKIMASHL